MLQAAKHRQQDAKELKEKENNIYRVKTLLLIVCDNVVNLCDNVTQRREEKETEKIKNRKERQAAVLQMEVLYYGLFNWKHTEKYQLYRAC